MKRSLLTALAVLWAAAAQAQGDTAPVGQAEAQPVNRSAA